MVRDLMMDIPEYVLMDNTRYADLVSAFGQLMNDYARAVAPAIKYIGGQYMNRDRVGDGRDPFVNVPKAEQEKALWMIVDRVFAPNALEIDPEMLRAFGSDRWTHWGNNGSSFGGRLDFPYHERMLAFQASVLGQLMHPWRLSRIRDGEAKFGQDQVVTIPELMGAVTDAIWSEVGSGSVNAQRRDLQRAYLDAMTRILVDPPARMPADARSVARWQLTQLAERIDSAEGASLDAYTQAHFAEAMARIHKALDAGLEAEGS